MKYRITKIKKVCNKAYLNDGDIIELEPIDSPSDDESYVEIKKPSPDDVKVESLDDELHDEYYNNDECDTGKRDFEVLAQIAKEHFQKHPDDINCIKKSEAIRQMIENNKESLKGMVSIEKVLEVLPDEMPEEFYMYQNFTLGKEWNKCVRSICKAIEQLKEKSCPE